MALSIDLGLKSYDIEDTDGNVVGTIRFNPSDVGLATRWAEAERKVHQLTEAERKVHQLTEAEYTDIEQLTEAEYTDIEQLTEAEYTDIERLAALDREIKAQIDYAFGTPVSGVLFRSVSSLAMCQNGKMVLENVLEALAPLIESAQQQAAKASAARVQKRTAKYQGSKAGLAPGQP